MENNRIKVLAVDDNQDNLISLRALIREFLPEARLLTAMSGITGLDLARAEDPDIILLDIVMPDMDGFEVCQKLKSDDTLRDIPVVFVTALKGDKVSRIRALECGAEAFLAKPIDEIELTAQIRAMAKIKTANVNKRHEHIYLAELVNKQTNELQKTHAATLALLEDLKQEIEARKISEEALQKSDSRHRTILQTAMDGIILLSAQGKFLEVNESFCRISGYSMQELLTMSISDLETPETANATASHLLMHIARSEDRFESRHIRKDGTIIDVEISVRFQPTDDGDAVVFIRDITGSKQATEELKKKNTEIEQFIYTVSHDLRSPLVTIKTFMGYLEKDMTDGNQQQLTEDIQYIHGAADKMKLLLDELLEMSRIGRIEAPPVKVSFRDILDEVRDMLAGVISERNVDIHISESVLMLYGDRQRLHQIWQNLIENAIKYSSNTDTPRIELGEVKVDGETVFFVRDNGIGIDPRYYGKVFGIFEKLDAKSPGAGLGLCMVQRIVEKSGGRIWVESDGEGHGSCFRFTLPAALFSNEQPCD